MTLAPTVLVRWLRAVGEPSRLRLLALCADAALSVSDMAQALKQSEPRVSRHLKILSEAGLIERLRQGQWVHYRLAVAPEASSFVRGLLAQLDRRDAQLLHDATSARAAIAADAQEAGHGTESRLGRALGEFVSAGAPAAVHGAGTQPARGAGRARIRRAARFLVPGAEGCPRWRSIRV